MRRLPRCFLPVRRSRGRHRPVAGSRTRPEPSGTSGCRRPGRAAHRRFRRSCRPGRCPHPAHRLGLAPGGSRRSSRGTWRTWRTPRCFGWTSRQRPRRSSSQRRRSYSQSCSPQSRYHHHMRRGRLRRAPGPPQAKQERVCGDGVLALVASRCAAKEEASWAKQTIATCAAAMASLCIAYESAALTANRAWRGHSTPGHAIFMGDSQGTHMVPLCPHAMLERWATPATLDDGLARARGRR
jgi:hypothetical protein